MKYRIITFVAIVFASLYAGQVLAQQMPERRLVRKGNRQFNRGEFDLSLDSYAKALQKDPNCFESKFNTANVQFRKAFADSTQVDTKMLEKAEKSLRKLAQDSTRTEIERGDIAYNLGNTLFMQQKLKDALGCYRDAMRFNPTDTAAKFNYALTKELLKQQQQQQQNQDQNQNQNQNQDKQNQDQNQNQNQDKQNQDQNQEQNNDQNQEEQNQGQNEQQISEQEQQAMLEAIQAQEDKTQEKMKEKKGVIIRGGKNW